MPKRSKLLQTLDFHRGRDYEAEKQKKLAKAAEKKKAEKKKKAALEEGIDEEAELKNGSEVKDKTNDKDEKQKKGKRNSSGATEEEKKEDENNSSDVGEQQEKSEDKEEETKPEDNDEGSDAEENEDEDDDEDGEEEEEDIPLSDLSEDEREDVIPHQRLTINNSAAINTSLKRISFITAATPFSEHNSLVSTHPIDVPDPNDDLNRELAFYKVCQDAATTARGLLKKEGIPFTRPGDYFAEMVKSDEHMGRIKKKLFDEAAAKKASAEARKQRDLKKFGKQVQVAKLQQRSKEKREMLEKIDVLKKKRKNDSNPTDDTEGLFDIEIDNATKPDTRKRSHSAMESSGPNIKRQKKNEKFGFGGKKRHSKSGDAMSTADMRNFSVKKMKGGSKRLGKSKRAAAKSRA